jgi:hypothetical protein
MRAAAVPHGDASSLQAVHDSILRAARAAAVCFECGLHACRYAVGRCSIPLLPRRLTLSSSAVSCYMVRWCYSLRLSRCACFPLDVPVPCATSQGVCVDTLRIALHLTTLTRFKGRSEPSRAVRCSLSLRSPCLGFGHRSVWSGTARSCCWCVATANHLERRTPVALARCCSWECSSRWHRSDRVQPPSSRSVASCSSCLGAPRTLSVVSRAACAVALRSTSYVHGFDARSSSPRT